MYLFFDFIERSNKAFIEELALWIKENGEPDTSFGVFFEFFFFFCFLNIKYTLRNIITFFCLADDYCWNYFLGFIDQHYIIFAKIKLIGVVFVSYFVVIMFYRYTFRLLCFIYYKFLPYILKSDILWIILTGFVNFILLLFSLYVWYYFDFWEPGFQFVYSIPLIKHFHIDFIIGFDGISVCFLLLTTFIMSICWFCGMGTTTYFKEFLVCLIFIEIFLIFSFILLDLFFFYVFFESVLIPMFIMIGIWGSRSRKIKAAYYFFLYTLFGSLFMLFGILFIYTITGTTDFYVLLNTILDEEYQLKLWICFFLPFAIKIPMFPFHIWLPEAHVEAPTIGSIILASLLLKLGGYGLLRFTLPMFSFGNYFFLPVIYMLGVIGVVYASLITIRQIDLKKIIAYSSVAHMNLIVLGLFSYTQQGIEGAIYLMIGHGIVSFSLFYCVGIIYDRYHTRLLRYYGGLISVMPLFSFYLLCFILANMGFPGTSNFIGELLILVGICEKNSFVMVFAATGIVLSSIYSIWVFNRIIFGALKLKYLSSDKFTDLNKYEKEILFYLLFSMMGLGIYSTIVTDLTSYPVILLSLTAYSKV